MFVSMLKSFKLLLLLLVGKYSWKIFKISDDSCNGISVIFSKRGFNFLLFKNTIELKSSSSSACKIFGI